MLKRVTIFVGFLRNLIEVAQSYSFKLRKGLRRCSVDPLRPGQILKDLRIRQNHLNAQINQHIIEVSIFLSRTFATPIDRLQSVITVLYVCTNMFISGNA